MTEIQKSARCFPWPDCPKKYDCVLAHNEIVSASQWAMNGRYRLKPDEECKYFLNRWEIQP